MKIAITGVAGFVGTNLAKRLVLRGDQVAGLDDLSHGTLENLKSLRDQPGFRFEEGSILDPKALERIAAGSEVMVHLAAGKIPRYGDALDTALFEAAFCFTCQEVRMHGPTVPPPLAKQFFDPAAPPARALLARFRAVSAQAES